MATDVQGADVQELLERYKVHYEVCPYYVLSEQTSAGARSTRQRVQAGFEVSLYGLLEKEQFPLFHSEAAHKVLSYFESVAQQITSRAGHQCTVEIIPCTDSVVLDAQEHFRPQAMLQIRITHGRGLDQPEGPSEDLALKAVEEQMHALGIRRA